MSPCPGVSAAMIHKDVCYCILAPSAISHSSHSSHSNHSSVILFLVHMLFWISFYRIGSGEVAEDLFHASKLKQKNQRECINMTHCFRFPEMSFEPFGVNS